MGTVATSGSAYPITVGGGCWGRPLALAKHQVPLLSTFPRKADDLLIRGMHVSYE